MNMISSNCRTCNEFQDVSFINQGSEGVVFKAKNNVDEHRYAIKKIPLPQHRNMHPEILKEAKLLAPLSHKNVLRYYAAWIENDCPPSEFSLQGQTESKSYLYIKTEICPNGTISKLIDEGLNRTDLNRRRRYARQLAKGLCYLHQNNVTHGDLHAGNVFLDDCDHIKIADFGLSLKHEKTESACSPEQEFKTRRIEDIENLRKLVVDLLVPFAKNNVSGTYGRDKRNFIDQNIEAPYFDEDLKNHILRLRALINAQDDLSTAQKVLDILNKNFIDDNNNMSTSMDVEKPAEAPLNNKTPLIQPICTPMEVKYPEETKKVRETSETSAKQENNQFGWFAAGLSTFGAVLCGVFAFVIVILTILVVWMVKENQKKDRLIRKLGSTYGKKLKPIVVSAMI